MQLLGRRGDLLACFSGSLLSSPAHPFSSKNVISPAGRPGGRHDADRNQAAAPMRQARQQTLSGNRQLDLNCLMQLAAT